MPITYIKRDTASDLTSTPALNTLVDEFYKAMNETTATSVEVSFEIAKGAIECLKWITDPGMPNKLDWEGGTYTWEFRVITANVDLVIIEVILRRLSSDGSTVKTSKSSGPISVSLGTTGIKTGSIIWDDGTQNPVGREQTDRLEIVFKIENLAAHATSAAGVGTNTTDDELITPLIAPPVSKTVTDTLSLTDVPAIEASLSVAESLALADVVATKQFKSVTDALTLTEEPIGVKAYTPISDSLALADVVPPINVSFTLTDSLALADIISAKLFKTVTDALALSEAVGIRVPITIADSLTLSEMGV